MSNGKIWSEFRIDMFLGIISNVIGGVVDKLGVCFLIINYRNYFIGGIM